MWIIKVYNESEGGLRSHCYEIHAYVYHPACPDLELGFAASGEISRVLSQEDTYNVGGKRISGNKLSEIYPKMKQETIDRALARAKKNLLLLRQAEDYAVYLIKE